MSSNVFYGIGEPLIQREEDTHVPAEAYLDLVKALGCGAYRSWMHLTEVLKDPSTPDPEAVSAHTRLLDRAAALGLEVTGMSHEWLAVMAFVRSPMTKAESNRNHCQKWSKAVWRQTVLPIGRGSIRCLSHISRTRYRWQGKQRYAVIRPTDGH